ncbi:MAG TPA: hypothetical protein VMW48_16860 [Vicinamibacterales bacterium]|nr:hypothetical protein [Vicinamibacterales bacterium]
MPPGDPATAATLRDGAVATIRPIRPDDEPLVVAFHQHVSVRSVRQRYFHLGTVEQTVAPR